MEAKNELLMKIIAKTITELMHKTLRDQLESSPGVGLFTSNAHHLISVTLLSKTCKYDFDISKEAWLTKRRWLRLVKDYMDIKRLKDFIKNCVKVYKDRSLVSTEMTFKNNPSHKWGNCLLAITYCSQKFTLYSRTTYLGYIAYLDVLIPYLLAKKVASQTSLTLKDFQFEWHITNQQISFLKVLPVVLLQPDLMAKLIKVTKDKNYPHNTCWWQIARVYRMRLLQGVFDSIKFGPCKRVFRKWLKIKSGKLKLSSVLTSELDFESL